MRWYHWVILAVVAIFTADWAWAHYEIWRKRRDLHIRAKDLQRFNMTAFRGARRVDKNRFLS
jgi:hypothetical protein